MTTADVTCTVAPQEAQRLRQRVRLLLEGEYLRLRGADRPDLLKVARSTEDGVDPDVVAGARTTVVVPQKPEPTLYGRVVVGLRESHQCADALAVGFAEADRRGADLLITLIRDPAAEDVPGNSLDPVFHAPDDADAEEADHLAASVAIAGRSCPEVTVRTVVRTGHFAEVLVELSHAADLVVLGMGERPTGMGRKDLLIASHSTCPVIVVRESVLRGGI